jgi:hypothetical protein
MILKKVMISLVCGILLVGTQSFAKPNKEHKVKKEKMKKQKHLPPGLQKKVARGGELPPGWQKKLVKGEVISNDVLRHAKIVRTSDYSKEPYKTIGSEVYKIEDKIIKVMKATNIIIDIFEL